MTGGIVGAMRPTVMLHQAGLTPGSVLDRYEAMMQDDAGQVWSFSCTHLHHSREAAKRCQARLAEQWEAWAKADRRMITPTLVEVRLGATLRRLGRRAERPCICGRGYDEHRGEGWAENDAWDGACLGKFRPQDEEGYPA